MNQDNVKKVKISSLAEADGIRIIVEDEVEADSLRSEILEPPESKRDDEEPFSVITITLKPWRGDSR